jgi:hypothetical protein
MNVAHENFISASVSSLRIDSQFEMVGVDEYTISALCYDNQIPAFAVTELKRLYSNIFSTIEKLENDGSLDGASAYVVRDDTGITCILLFRHDGKRIRVLNEFIELKQLTLQRFSRRMFYNYPTASVITFGPLQTDKALAKFPYPYQRINCSEDIVIPLPPQPGDYLGALNKSMRLNINRYRNKLKKDFPSFTFAVQEKDQIVETDFRDIMKLSRARMTAKGKNYGFDEEKEGKLYKLARTTGIIGVATIDGRLCAGTICYQVGSQFFIYILAFDPTYKEYGLGAYCCYLTICECISRGGEKCHFLWGREAYKYRLLGIREDFDSMAIYRSRAHIFLHALMALKMEYRGYVRRFKLWLLDPAHQNSVISRFIAQPIRILKTQGRLIVRSVVRD